MKIAMLLSGGVDSSVAMRLLKEQGHDITAFYLKIWLEDELAFLGECPWEDDLNNARAVCKQAGVPLEIVNMQSEYLNTVVEYVVRELKAGRTPSPDVMCNKNIKFGEFFNKIDSSFEKVASGHYAKVEESGGKFFLKEAPDPVKDQTYFLTYLDQAQLGRILFPLGDYTKAEVREMAERYQLPNAKRKDSQGICFLGKIKYNDFIKFHLGELPGPIIDIETGNEVGSHKGYWFHTIGQRQGLGLSDGPWYVAKKDIEKNIIYVNRKNVQVNIPHDKFFTRHTNWIGSEPENGHYTIKLRHGARKYSGDIELLEPGKVFVHLDQKDQGISPGQFSIFYDEGYCLGGGVIALA